MMETPKASALPVIVLHQSSSGQGMAGLAQTSVSRMPQMTHPRTVHLGMGCRAFPTGLFSSLLAGAMPF